MEVLIITGMSGSGKSKVVDVLEDSGYFCVDNIPPSLLKKFGEIFSQADMKIKKIAIVVDARGKQMFTDLFESLDELELNLQNYKLLFLDCDDTVLLRRYKETRRKHPLIDEYITIEQAIKQERELLFEARERADFVIDTTSITAVQLRDMVKDIFTKNSDTGMVVNCMSFGFKYGIPTDVDLVFDVRCLPNPFYVAELKYRTGLEQTVKDYVLKFEEAKGLYPKIFDLIDYLLPLYVNEGKSQLVIAFGCTGGKHRSVVFAELMSGFVQERGLRSVINHRDIEKK